MAEKSNIEGVREVVQCLWEKHGVVESTKLVDAARPKDSPAHPAFLWDNRKAGEEYRLIQARNLIRRVTIIRNEVEEPLVHVPRIEPATGAGHYQVPSVLAEHPDEFSRAVSAARSRVAGAKVALEELYAVAEKSERTSEVAKIGQMAQALDLFKNALEVMH